MKKINAPKARQLPSGAWNCQVMVNGIRKSFTGNTKSDVENAAIKWKLGVANSTPASGTLGEAIERYISERENSLSPSTIRRYRQFQQNDFQAIQRRSLGTLTSKDFQKAVDEMKKTHAPKTIANTWGFLASVLKANGIVIPVKLPQDTSDEPPFLQPEEIPLFLDALAGEKNEIPVLLALHGLRRSEITALKWNDIDLKKRVLKVRGAYVQDSDGIWVQKKETKNRTSRRQVPIVIPRLIELLEDAPKNTPHVCTCAPGTIRRVANRACQRAGLPEVSTHGLRHSAVSLWYHLGIPELASMKLGGYRDYQTMRRIYTHFAASDMTSATKELEQFFEGEE